MSEAFRARRGWRGRIVAALLTIAIAALFWAHRFALPGFVDLFRGFGAELPTPTKALIAYYSYVWGFLHVAMLMQVGLLAHYFRSTDHSARSAFAFVTIANFSTAVVLWAALYAPVFALGQTI